MWRLAQAQQSQTAAVNVDNALKLENGLLIVMLVPMLLKLIVYRRARACAPAGASPAAQAPASRLTMKLNRLA